MHLIRLPSSARQLALAVASAAAFACASAPLASFETPHAAMQAVVAAAEADDAKAAERIFGADGIELLRSGDEVADREDALRVKQSFEEKLAFEELDADTAIALLGHEAWPFPIPLVREAGTWRFDVAAGEEELTNRRIGRNELSTLATLHEYVEAQREYAAQGRDGNPPCYARRLISTAGKHDGLYWPVADGEPESPLGQLVASAAQEGYSRSDSGPTPYHGYFYRSLERQGPRAPGGAKSYVDDKGLMTRGFALLAWPAKYGNSGVMTFVVGRNGIVFQCDLGANTEAAAAAITAFDPDESWTPTSD